MRIVPAVTITLAGFFATDGLASDVRVLKFPDSALGSWAPNADSCSGPGRKSVRISPTSHVSADANCQVAWITVTASRDGPVYSARSNCTKDKSGKQEPPSYLVVSPRPDGKLLVRMPGAGPDDELVTYQKCP
jgi:hypothetical protein